jgi:hypothetical protein
MRNFFDRVHEIHCLKSKLLCKTAFRTFLTSKFILFADILSWLLFSGVTLECLILIVRFRILERFLSLCWGFQVATYSSRRTCFTRRHSQLTATFNDFSIFKGYVESSPTSIEIAGAFFFQFFEIFFGVSNVDFCLFNCFFGLLFILSNLLS